MIDPQPSAPADARRTELRLPKGLLGFPHATAFSLMGSVLPGVFLLNGVDPGSPRFVLADPFMYFDRYEVDLPEADLGAIHANASSDICILTVAVPDFRSGRWTANLQGPLAINVQEGLGIQIVLPSGSWGVRHPFLPGGEAAHPETTQGLPAASTNSSSVEPDGVLMT